MVIIWGIILIGTGWAKNFATLIVLRVLLGALEAPVAPGNFIILTMWYTRAEQPVRTGLFTQVCVQIPGPTLRWLTRSSGLANLITGTLGWAVGFIDGENAWRSFFWVTGGITIVYGCVVGVFLPDNPVKAKLISERERFVAIERVRADQLGIENKHFDWEQFKEVAFDHNFSSHHRHLFIP